MILGLGLGLGGYSESARLGFVHLVGHLASQKGSRIRVTVRARFQVTITDTVMIRTLARTLGKVIRSMDHVL